MFAEVKEVKPVKSNTLTLVLRVVIHLFETPTYRTTRKVRHHPHSDRRISTPISRQWGRCKRRGTRLWNYLDELLPKPLFSLCVPSTACFGKKRALKFGTGGVLSINNKVGTVIYGIGDDENENRGCTDRLLQARERGK